MSICQHPGALDDAGDLELSDDAAEARAAIESGVAGLLARGATPIVLGGDHSITYPVLRAFHKHLTGLTIVHFDAHGDLYDEFEGDRFSHACPFARIMEEGLAVRLVQIGIRTLTAHQREQAKKFGVEIYDATRWSDAPLESVAPPLYLSIDLDVLDPAYAPGRDRIRSRGACPRARYCAHPSASLPGLRGGHRRIQPEERCARPHGSVGGGQDDQGGCRVSRTPLISPASG